MNRNANIAVKIAKGDFKPHSYLTNMAMAHFQESKNFVSGRMFPHLPVSLSTSYYYEFNKGDLLRDNVGKKPSFGSVAPAVVGHTEKLYRCEVDQVITGLDAIAALDYQRSGTPHIIDPRKSKVAYIMEQLLLHQDIVWGEKFFNPLVWKNVYQGTASTPGAGEFYHFDNDNSDPVLFMAQLATKMTQSGLRKPNKLCMGAKVFAALQNNASILDRVKYGGSEANPANVTLNVLAQLFKLDEVLVSEGVYNAASVGAEDDFRFICNENDMLLVYAPSGPSLEEPSAGYTFVWDMLGNGTTTPVLQFEGPGGTHTEMFEGWWLVTIK